MQALLILHFMVMVGEWSMTRVISAMTAHIALCGRVTLMSVSLHTLIGQSSWLLIAT